MKTARGFTLIELIITVAIVAILATIAYPSYEEHVRKTRRGDAKAVLLQGQQWMERFYTENFRYDQNRAGVLVTNATQFPASGLTRSPLEGATTYYDIALVNPTPTTYTLRATPRAATSQAKDKCKILDLDNTGVRQADGKPANDPLTLECWR
jgi:type IV pilus assembly protein PilE